MTDSSGETRWCFDERGRVTMERHTVAGADYEILSFYDSADRPVRTVYVPDTADPDDPENEWLYHTYDNYSGLPATLSRDDPFVQGDEYTYVSGATYDAGFRTETVTMGNGAVTANTYDNRGRIEHTETNEGPNGLQWLDYQYDSAGNVTGLLDGTAGEVFKYCYDELDRLTKGFLVTGATPDCSDPGAWTQYAFDEIGNLTQTWEPGTPYTALTYDTNYKSRAQNAWQGGILGSFSYDGNGNMTARDLGGVVTNLTYDAENRLASQTAGGVTSSYVYDGDGGLAERTVGSDTTVYAGGLFEKNLTTGEVTKYYSFNGGAVAMRKGGTLSYLLRDSLGSTSTVLDGAGAIVATQRYYPSGRTRTATGTMPTDKLFTGYQQEDELYFAQARFYDPMLMRFTQPDTIVPDPGDPQSLNRYSYVVNNPLRYTDPTGREYGLDGLLCLLGCGNPPRSGYTPPPARGDEGPGPQPPTHEQEPHSHGPTQGNLDSEIQWASIDSACATQPNYCPAWLDAYAAQVDSYDCGLDPLCAAPGRGGQVDFECAAFGRNCPSDEELDSYPSAPAPRPPRRTAKNDPWEDLAVIVDFLATRDPGCYAFAGVGTGMVIVALVNPGTAPTMAAYSAPVAEAVMTSCFP